MGRYDKDRDADKHMIFRFANGSNITAIDSDNCKRGCRAKIYPYHYEDYIDWYLTNKDIMDEILRPFKINEDKKMNKYCIMPEQPYCPCCKFNITDYGDAETYEDILGTHTNIRWVCTCSEADEEEYHKHLWFCLCCYYHATTELYDRSLTDMRSPYDPTEAFIVGDCRSASAANATRTFTVVRHIANKYGIPQEIQSLGLCYGGGLFSAQHWIENYKYLKQNGEMDFIEREIK